MSFLQGIRKKIGYFILQRKVSSLSRKKEFVNLSDARNVGVLFQQIDSKSFDAVQDFVRTLRSEGKDVLAIGFVDLETIPDSYLLRKGFNFFCRNDLNWFYKPEAGFIDEFIARDFDLVINLSIDDLLPLDYIYALSKAKFKAGRYRREGPDYADFSIDIKKSRDIEYLIQQINHYLQIINKKQ